MNGCFILTTGVHNRCNIDTYGWPFYVLMENLDTSLLLFLKVMLISLSILMGCLTAFKGLADR